MSQPNEKETAVRIAMFGLGTSKKQQTSGKFWVTEPDAVLQPQVGQSGFAAVPPRTVIEVFRSCVEKHGDKKALFLRRAVNVRPTTFLAR